MYQRQLTFQEAIEKALKFNYCNFSGRASRSEYWWFLLFTFILGVVLQVALQPISHTLYFVVSALVELALLLPCLGLAVRRLHDISKSGWWILLGLIPVVGLIILIIWFCQPSNNVPNQYGGVPNVE